MKTFAYRGYDVGGQAVRGLIEALDIKDARERLSGQGVLAEKVDAVSGAATSGSGRSRSPGVGVRSQMFEELGALLKAGLPLSDALDAMLRGTADRDLAFRLAGVRDRVVDGSGLAGALIAAGFEMTAYERALLETGERTGGLGECVERLAAFLEEQRRVMERIRSSLVYPSIVLGLSFIIAAGMLGFVLPSLSKLFTESRIELPWLTRALIGFGTLFSRWGLPALFALGVGVFTARSWLLGSDERLGTLNRMLFSIPSVGRVLRDLACFRFAGTLAMLLRGGVQLVEAFVLAGSATGSRWIQSLAATGAEEIRHGGSVSRALRQIPPLSRGLPEWVQAGEAGGDLPGLLEKASARFEHQWQQSVSRVVGLVEPILIIGVGIFVLLVSLAVLMPILSLNRTMM